MQKWLVRVACWLGVALLVLVEMGACHDVGGGAERPPASVGDVQLNQ